MVSKEFKELVNGIKKSGWDIWDIPSYILVDKTTGTVKPSPKNTKAFELVQLVSKLSQSEQNSLQMGKRKGASDPYYLDMIKYVDATLGTTRNNFVFVDSIFQLYKDYTKKLSTLQSKRERDIKKAGVAAEKQRVINSLNRTDVANTIVRIKKSLDPYISKIEADTAEKLQSQNKQFHLDVKKTFDGMKKGGIKFYTDYINDDPLKNLSTNVSFTNVVVDGTKVPFYRYLLQSRLPLSNWLDDKGRRSLKSSTSYFLSGNVNSLIDKTNKLFRDYQYGKVDTLFMRLFRLNPTLRDYTMIREYNGSEFTLSAKNDKDEEIIIQTNTILAGGYNIQRLHSRWLVNVKNTVTNKTEKFTITDTK